MAASAAVVLSLTFTLSSCKDDSTFADAGPTDASAADARTDLPRVEFPDTVSGGLVNCGSTGSAMFTVDNTGGGDLTYDIEANNSLFTISPASGTILADTSTTFTVTAMVPADSMPGVDVTADFTITTNLSPIAHVVHARVAPRGGVVTLTPTAAGFADVEMGSTATRTVVLENHGNGAVSVAIGNPTDDEFDIEYQDGMLAVVGASRDADVHYSPGGLGTDNATATVTVTGAVCGIQPTSLSMSANGVPPGGVIVTGNLAFGNVACGAASSTATVSMFNDGPVPATWTATCPDADCQYYMPSAIGGTIQPGATEILTVTRMPIPLPAEPRTYNVAANIHTVGALTQDHPIPISQSLNGAFLEVDEGDDSLDFGWAPNAEVLTTQVTVHNTGNASATATFTEVGSGVFSVPQAGATIAMGAEATFDASYTSNGVDDTFVASVNVAATGLCNAPLAIGLAAGEGPWTVWYEDPLNLDRYCGQQFFHGGPDDYIYFINIGNQELQVGPCAEIVASDLDPSFSPSSGLASAGGGYGQIGMNFDGPSPQVSGTTNHTLRCDTNERFHTTRDLAVQRDTHGGDLVVTLANGPLDFNCSDAPPNLKQLTVTNNGTDAVYVYLNGELPYPLQTSGGGYIVPASGGVVTQSGVGMGSGCSQGGTGTVWIEGAKSSVCSVTPADFPVTLTYTPPP